MLISAYFKPFEAKNAYFSGLREINAPRFKFYLPLFYCTSLTIFAIQPKEGSIPRGPKKCLITQFCNSSHPVKPYVIESPFIIKNMKVTKISYFGIKISFVKTNNN